MANQLPPAAPPPLTVIGPWTNLIIFGLTQIASSLVLFDVFLAGSTEAKICSVVVQVLSGISTFLGHNSPSTIKALRKGSVGLKMKGP